MKSYRFFDIFTFIVKKDELSQMQELKNQRRPQHWFFLLINTKSGGGWGKCYLQLQKQQYQFQNKDNKTICVSLHDLLDKKSKLKGLQKAVQLQRQSHNLVTIVICGGDGTVIWALEQSLKAGIDFEKVSFTVIPIGTGNDFSRSLGWGYQHVEFNDKNITPLKKRVIQWMQAEKSHYDIWQVNITTYEDGQITKVQNQKDFVTGTQHTVGFSNYLGIGVDARVTYSFEMNRQSSKCMNLTVYTCCGLWNLCKSIQELSSSFEYFSEQTNHTEQFDHSNHTPTNLNHQESKIHHQNLSKRIYLEKGYHGIVCLNSLSYMAGATEVWETKNIANKDRQVKFEPQAFNDGLIEFVAYHNELKLGLESLCHTGAKVAQGKGPFFINFKKNQKYKDTFVQIDGQAIKVKHLKQLKIQKHSRIPNGRISVLTKKNP